MPLRQFSLPPIAATVAVVPPLALLAAVHGVSILVSTRAHTRTIHGAATAMTMLIAAGAFWLSFNALRSLALLAGVPAGEAWLWPLIVEGSMAQSTIALLALAHSANRAHADHPDNQSQAGNTLPGTDDDPGVASPNSVHTPAVLGPNPEQFAALAQMVCARDPGRRRDPDLIVQILTHHHLDGWNTTQIAEKVSRCRSTISRIISETAQLADAETHQRQLGPHRAR
ncbi:DUF2637 domain-containing protein [Nocardia brasiliensis]|uniref:DUF2637 domain-containing protein n=1 Tax=Nocardia brasiliensis TaxID=37326 RepID=UPI002457DBC7|nr:DUF2637 domain-containing protein [Nocardia brasiliensis]